MTCDEKYLFLLQEVIKALAFELWEYPSPTDIKVKYMYIYIVLYRLNGRLNNLFYMKEKEVRLLERPVFLLYKILYISIFLLVFVRLLVVSMVTLRTSPSVDTM